MSKPNHDRLDRVVAEARSNLEQREQGYRERALKIYPWICGRCARQFTRENLHQLTVPSPVRQSRVATERWK
jgi:hypothetical protein